MNIVQNKSTIYRPGIYNLQNCNISRSGKIAGKSWDKILNYAKI